MRFSKILRLNLRQRAIGDSIASPLLRRSDEEASLRRDYEASTTACLLGQILTYHAPSRAAIPGNAPVRFVKLLLAGRYDTRVGSSNGDRGACSSMVSAIEVLLVIWT